jgi:hypothetical protein
MATSVLAVNSLDTRVYASGSNAAAGAGAIYGSYFRTDEVNMADDTSYKFANAGNNQGALFNIFSYSGNSRPGQVVLAHIGTESDSDMAFAAIGGQTATWSGNVQAVAGAYQASAPSGTGGTDGYVTIWAAYPQGAYVINRLGVTMYFKVTIF